MKRFLYIFQSAPYTGSGGQEGLDAVLAASVLNVEVSVLFCDDGVFQVKSGQQAANQSELKTYTKAFAALEDFEIDAVFAESSSLAARGLTLEDLIAPAQELDQQGVRSLIAQQDRVMVF